MNNYNIIMEQTEQPGTIEEIFCPSCNSRSATFLYIEHMETAYRIFLKCENKVCGSTYVFDLLFNPTIKIELATKSLGNKKK